MFYYNSYFNTSSIKRTCKTPSTEYINIIINTLYSIIHNFRNKEKGKKKKKRERNKKEKVDIQPRTTTIEVIIDFL